MQTADIHLSVVIPAFNEERRIGRTLEIVSAYLLAQQYRSELIVVNDGSADRTAEIVSACEYGMPIRLLVHERNQGKGASVRDGMLASRGAHVLFSDADLSTPIEEVGKFWSKFSDGADVVIGSRALPDSEILERQPKYREFMGRVFNVFVQSLAIRGISDTQCGFKAFTHNAAQTIFSRQRIMGWGFDAELLFIARRHGLQIAQVPVRWINSRDSRINSIRDSYRMFAELLIIRKNGRRGFYD